MAGSPKQSPKQSPKKSPVKAPTSPKVSPKLSPKASPKKRPADDSTAPPAKKAKTAEQCAVIRKQIEYYLSDKNLSGDKFFHEKISEDKDGWLGLTVIQSCNKIKALNCSNDDIQMSLIESALEVKKDGEEFLVRRPDGKGSLPKLDPNASRARPRVDAEKKRQHAHDGGVLIRIADVPEEITWVPIKNALKELLPESARVQFATTVSEKGTCVILCSPFDGDIEFAAALKLVVDGQTLKHELVHGQQLQDCLTELPKHVQKRREVQAKQRQKKRMKPVILAGQKFANIATVRGKVKEIIMARKDGQMLIEGSPDTALIRAIMDFHPRAAEKIKNVKGIKVDVSGHAATPGAKPSRCFHIVKEDKTTEDISMVKCFIELETKLNDGELDEKEEKKEEKKEEPKSPKKA